MFFKYFGAFICSLGFISSDHISDNLFPLYDIAVIIAVGVGLAPVIIFRQPKSDSPVNIGTFTGMQIVKKYLERFPATTLAELMKTDAGEIYSKAKYKPGS